MSAGKGTAPPMSAGKGTAPVRKMTTWFTESASAISATQFVGETCSQLVETSLPDTIIPNMAIFYKIHQLLATNITADLFLTSNFDPKPFHVRQCTNGLSDLSLVE